MISARMARPSAQCGGTPRYPIDSRSREWAILLIPAAAAVAWRWLPRATIPGSVSPTHRARDCAAQFDAPDVQRGTADRPDLLSGRAIHGVRIRSRWEFRHLGTAGFRRGCGAGHEFTRRGYRTELVPGWQHDRIPVGARQRWNLCRAGASTAARSTKVGEPRLP
jgi:hypothetical protein